jgi:hypothetical protein
VITCQGRDLPLSLDSLFVKSDVRACALFEPNREAVVSKGDLTVCDAT